MIENDDNTKLDEMVLKGTTTTGIVCTDGIVMATDTRVVMGLQSHINKVRRYTPLLTISL